MEKISFHSGSKLPATAVQQKAAVKAAKQPVSKAAANKHYWRGVPVPDFKLSFLVMAKN